MTVTIGTEPETSAPCPMSSESPSIAAVAAPAPEPAASTCHRVPVGYAKASKIMMVDDEPLTIKVVRKYLQGFGYENFVSTSESLRALEMIRQEQPDVVILDIVMPNFTGLEILAMI